MGEKYVIVDLSSATPIAVEIGDHFTYRGETFSIYNVPSALKQARRNTYGEAFKYEGVKFSFCGSELSEAMFFDYVLNSARSLTKKLGEAPQGKLSKKEKDTILNTTGAMYL